MDFRDTLTKPEYVLKSWSSGTFGVVATNRRIFIRRGLISKSVLGMRYENIKAIEHLERYPWKIPIFGAVISGLAFFAPTFQNLLAEETINQITLQVQNLQQIIPQPLMLNGNLPALLTALPFLISLIIFLVQARTGFQLCAEGTKPIYLSCKFKKAVEFIRQIQDLDFDGAKKINTSKESLESLINPN